MTGSRRVEHFTKIACDMLRAKLYANPGGCFLHELVLASCQKNSSRTAIVDTSCNRRISYADYGEFVASIARGLIAAGIRPAEVVAIFLPNSWEFCVAYHAITLAGAIPTLLNPAYREREVLYQLANSGAAMLISDGPNLDGISLSSLPELRRVYTTRTHTAGSHPFASLLQRSTQSFSQPEKSSSDTLAALPYSSGTTGLPKGVMLSHFNLVSNIYQILGPHGAPFRTDEKILCFLPLYHIYGLNVILNPALLLGATLVLMPRFQSTQLIDLISREEITMMPLVPPAINAICQLAEEGKFPADHKVRWVKSGAAPLAADLPRRFTSLTGIPVAQGYGMTEASPVTHLGYLEPELYLPDSIGQPVALTECRVVADDGKEAETGQLGELVMRGPQFMGGYWKEPDATAAALPDGWYWSGDIVTRDANNFFRVVDRRKEMIKYKGFPIAPAEVEALLMEHPAVRDCGVIGRADGAAGEVPVAFIVLRAGHSESAKLERELCAYVAERLTSYKQPREIRFVASLPRTPSGKILRRELRAL